MNSNALDRHHKWGIFIVKGDYLTSMGIVYRQGGLFIDKGDYLSSSGIINRQEVLIIVNGGFFFIIKGYCSLSRWIIYRQERLFIVKGDCLSSRWIINRQEGLIIINMYNLPSWGYIVMGFMFIRCVGCKQTIMRSIFIKDPFPKSILTS